MTASTLCMIEDRRWAQYADAQYWGRYGRCIVKGYPCYYRLHGGSISYLLPRSRIFLPHITCTPAMYSHIFRSRILHIFSPTFPHFINTRIKRICSRRSRRRGGGRIL